MNLIIYDIEIINAIPPNDEKERIPGIHYCKGWDDKAGMGIACLVAYDTQDSRIRVFQNDNLPKFAELVANRDAIMGWNNHNFDDPVLIANHIAIPCEKSIDLAAILWKAAGIAEGQRPSGMGLDAVCTANGLPGKTGHGADAPIDWQQGRPGKVIDYCLGDVYALLRLYRRIAGCGGFRDPRQGNWIHVQVPR